MSNATLLFLEIENVVCRGLALRPNRTDIAVVGLDDLEEPVRQHLRQAWRVEATDSSRLYAVPVEAEYPFVGAVLMEKRGLDGVTQRDRHLVGWLARLAAVVAEDLGRREMDLDEEMAMLQTRRVRDAVAAAGSILGASHELGMSRQKIRDVLGRSNKRKMK